MPKLVSAPKITYTCRCGAVSEAEPNEFTQDHTMPPRYHIACAFCGADVVCYPTALIMKFAVAFAHGGEPSGRRA